MVKQWSKIIKHGVPRANKNEVGIDVRTGEVKVRSKRHGFGEYPFLRNLQMVRKCRPGGVWGGVGLVSLDTKRESERVYTLRPTGGRRIGLRQDKLS